MTIIRSAAATLVLAIAMAATGQASRFVVPDPNVDDPRPAAKSPATLVLAGGCFWGMEEVFQHVRGVLDVTSGYAGGSARDANYEAVSSGTTGHAESVEIRYDPAKISMGQLLKVYFSVAHDPTQRGYQGPVRGPQYRSAIFFSSPRQEEIAKAYIAQLTAAHAYKDSITTQVVRLTTFYPAEAYHQDFARKNPTHRYIVAIDLPKVEDLRHEFAGLYVKEAQPRARLGCIDCLLPGASHPAGHPDSVRQQSDVWIAPCISGALCVAGYHWRSGCPRQWRSPRPPCRRVPRMSRSSDTSSSRNCSRHRPIA
jgi:peptide-methionine (S)-S-oxide reductase